MKKASQQSNNGTSNGSSKEKDPLIEGNGGGTVDTMVKVAAPPSGGRMNPAGVKSSSVVAVSANDNKRQYLRDSAV